MRVPLERIWFLWSESKPGSWGPPWAPTKIQNRHVPGRLSVPLRTRFVVVMFWKAVHQNDVERGLGSESGDVLSFFEVLIAMWSRVF